MNEKERLLEKYDGPNQDTKREIIRHLYNNPDIDHDAEAVFEAIRGKCRAGTVGTVKNQLSELSKNEDIIQLEKRSFYRWEDTGNPNPDRRFENVKKSFKQWTDSLGISYGTLLLGIVVWAIGILNAIFSLIALFTSGYFVGYPFNLWFQLSGLFTIMGSSIVIAWIPLYFLDIRISK